MGGTSRYLDNFHFFIIRNSHFFSICHLTTDITKGLSPIDWSIPFIGYDTCTVSSLVIVVVVVVVIVSVYRKVASKILAQIDSEDDTIKEMENTSSSAEKKETR